MTIDVRPGKDMSDKSSSSIKSSTCLITSLSVRGFNKVATSQSYFLKLMWTLYISMMTAMLLYGIIQQFISYRGYMVVQKVDRLGKNAEKFGSVFPTVTLCMNNPFSYCAHYIWSTRGNLWWYNNSRRTKCKITVAKVSQVQPKSDIRSPQRFGEQLREMAYKAILKSNDYEQADKLVNLNTFHNFLEYAQLEEIPTLLESNAKNLITCLFLERNSSFSCQVVPFRHPSYPACFTINVVRKPRPSHLDEDDERSLDALILHVNRRLVSNRPVKYSWDWFLGDQFRLTGQVLSNQIRIHLHEQDEFPSMDRRGLELVEGIATDIHYQRRTTQHLDTPAKACTRSRYVVQHRNRSYWSTDSDVCRDVWLQTKIIDRCKCQDFKRPKINANLPMCNQFDLSYPELFYRKEECRSGIIQSYLKETMDKCLIVCKENIYKYKLQATFPDTTFGLTSLTWNRKFDQLLSKHVAYQCRIQKPPNQTATCRAIENQLKQHLIYTQPAKSHTSTSSTIITLHNDLAMKADEVIEEETLLVPMEVFLSQLGGLCSLTIGLTPVVLIELIEYIYTKLSLRSSKEISNKQQGN